MTMDITSRVVVEVPGSLRSTVMNDFGESGDIGENETGVGLSGRTPFGFGGVLDGGRFPSKTVTADGGIYDKSFMKDVSSQGDVVVKEGVELVEDTVVDIDVVAIKKI